MNKGPSIIVAATERGAIGKDGLIPWHLPHDLRRFKSLTGGDAVILGRRTWESLPPKVRPLPGRYNIVLTRDPCAVLRDCHGAHFPNCVTYSLDRALRHASGLGLLCWIIGGAEVYREALEVAETVELTVVEGDFDGDVFFPLERMRELFECKWSEPSTGCRFEHWERKR